jgi:hypothetical protein
MGGVMKDYRIVAKVKNNRIVSRIEAAGFSSVSAFCIAHNLSKSDVGELIAMKVAPVGRRGWGKTVLNLASALHVEPEALFNEKQFAGNAHSGLIVREVDDPTISLENTSIEDRMLPSPDEAVTAKIDAQHFMECLSPRERLVVEMSFGMNGHLESTLDEIALQIGGVTRERARQLLFKSLRKMRHPSRAHG